MDLVVSLIDNRFYYLSIGELLFTSFFKPALIA